MVRNPVDRSRYGYGSESTENLASFKRIETTESQNALVVGSSQLFKDGKRRHVPMPTPDPKDPLNLPEWRKTAAVASLCFFGALGLAAEIIIGALVPVFVLEYAGIDPKILGQLDLKRLFPPGQVNSNPLQFLAGIGPALSKVALLSSLPLLINGLASFILVPLSIAIGRRPVLLFAGILAWSGGWWAGCSQSLNSHLAARAFQGLGAGAVEALIPLIIQDMLFIHQRNRSISSVGASQGFFIVSLGVTAPLIITRLSWRWIYYLTSGAAMVAWVMMFFFVPETRWIRTPDELAGKEVYSMPPGETRPPIDFATFGPRTRRDDLGLFTARPEWKLAAISLWETVRTTFFPNIAWVILVNSALVAIQGAAGQVGSTVFLSFGLKFELLGLVVLPIVVATPFVWFFGGFVADKISNAHARRNGGRREPEAHLLSLIFPLVAATAGSILFGYAGQNVGRVPPFAALVSLFLIGFGFLTVNALFAVYLVESYPAHAGPVLVNVSSIRLIIGFGLSFGATDWIAQIGFLRSFELYSAVVLVTCLFGPLVYLYGKRLRAWTGGKLDGTSHCDENEMKTYPIHRVESYVGPTQVTTVSMKH